MIRFGLPYIKIFVCILKNFRLDFVHHYNLWGGSVATIVPNLKEHVWGAVWKMQCEELPSLDKYVSLIIWETTLK